MATREETALTCNKCGQTKPTSEFHKASKNIGFRKWLCKDCSAEYSRGYYAKHRQERNRKVSAYDKTDMARFTRLKSNAKKRNTEFLLDKLEFLIWFKEQIKQCYYCGIGLNVNGKRAEQLSIDRKENNIGYILENIVLSCQRCNTIKGDVFTEQEMLEIAERYLKPKMEVSYG